MLAAVPKIRFVVTWSLLGFTFFSGTSNTSGETLRHPATLEQQLKATSVDQLAQQVSLRGDARRGAVVFYKSAASCAKCHVSDQASPLGPDLAKIGKDADGNQVTDQHLIESLLYPSRSIRPGYETINIVKSDGQAVSGLLVADKTDRIVLRNASDLTEEISVAKDDIDAQRKSDKSMMPEGLIGTLTRQRDFLDLVKYVSEVARGGSARAAELKPTAEQLIVKDDTANLDHAGIIKRLGSRDFEFGKKIFHGYCYNCHGSDGNKPSLPTARAFGTQKLKYGADPYKMFLTLSKGNGLMAPMSHLTPKERYQVVHYIREAFMKDKNPDYQKVKKDYLASLPEGTENGTRVEVVKRNYGPALASQLGREFTSVLTIKLGSVTVSYDLNSMDQAGVWENGFLDLSETQHARDRGEGTANPNGKHIAALAGWSWGHDGTMDYSRNGFTGRGPIPQRWMHYRGHHLHGGESSQVVLNYQIDGRDVLELPSQAAIDQSIRHTLRIGPGKALVLCVANPTVKARLMSRKANNQETDATKSYLLSKSNSGAFVSATVHSESSGMRWEVDAKNRMLLHIPSDTKTRTIQVTASSGTNDTELKQSLRTGDMVDPETFIHGGQPVWPGELATVGYLGLESAGYALDTITIPESTPWNTWFRTSALDFFPDGRMAVSTYGGDVWIVTGVDDDLVELKWKRFAGGLYEPFGLKVIDGKLLVTCKDRLVRLHDRNNDGEADFYESFSADPDVSPNFHSFNFDLQVDRDGTIYYAKSGHGGDSPLPGYIVQVSPDGKQRSVHCTGFRSPNGIGILPDGRITASDNQGQWTPASKVSLCKPGGFYGWVNNYSKPGMWAPGGGTIDLEKVEIPKSFDQPLIWMPQEFDNSSGGQLFVKDKRWGPLSGRLLHTSFGKGWMSYMMMQDFGDVAQAAIVKLPFDFQTGIMRARVNPVDGQVYATGLQGWNGGARHGLLGHGVQRLRYTGAAHRMVSDCQVEPDGLRIRFNFALDATRATQLSAYQVNHWNYLWQESYGSDQYSPSTGKKGIDKLNVTSVTIDPDGKGVKLHAPELKPVHQVHAILKLADSDGKDFQEEIYWTINRTKPPK